MHVYLKSELSRSGSAAGLLSFDPKAAATGIRGTAGVVGIPSTEGIVVRARREGSHLGDRRYPCSTARLQFWLSYFYS
jgi:hypothetical protein